MDPEILRRKANMNGSAHTVNGNGIASSATLPAAVKVGAVKTTDGLTMANGTTGAPAVNGTNGKIISAVAA